MIITSHVVIYNTHHAFTQQYKYINQIFETVVLVVEFDILLSNLFIVFYLFNYTYIFFHFTLHFVIKIIQNHFAVVKLGQVDWP